jgi:ribosome-binding protein aMBF1 (putative translation factor)
MWCQGSAENMNYYAMDNLESRSMKKWIESASTSTRTVSDAEVETAARGLARAIRVRRLKLGLSQEELANRSQLHRTYISDVERKSRNISFKNMCRIAWALQTDCHLLVAEAEGFGENLDEEGLLSDQS